ncbi:CBS domain-containing protein [Neobacillus niacini]|jgi:predicted transcriptional regulator|uniref:CBS domain-containing protein n=1 Tax=Neobacillus niacini TaxID=86668 RepID=UPI002040A3B8|nr:CBS domain-containing protein [Neobacillus niacini]MCM3694145.1 CBS domain-containing protein [Neobacillus niacini]
MKQVKKAPILSERFEVAFNQVHDAMKDIVKINDDRFVVLVKVGAKKYQIIETFKKDLEQYAKLRNAIVHEKMEVGYYIAEPNARVVEHIEKIAHVFNRPNYALTIATRNVIYFDYNDRILKVTEAIRQFNYSKFPIYKNKEFVGLLTAGAIVKWMAQNMVSGSVNLDDTHISDIMKYEKDHPIDFVAKSTNIFDVETIFEKSHKVKKKLEAVIITENGKKDETPLGIVTPWDLIEIDYTVE